MADPIALTYTILQGDTLTSIAAGVNASAGITYKQIQNFNDSSGSDLTPGQRLQIPAVRDPAMLAMIYTVQSGDSYYLIAAHLSACAGVTVSNLEDANPGVDVNNLQVGGTLQIPATQALSSQLSVPTLNIGYWNQTWTPSGPPAGATMGFAFSGYADPTAALHCSQQVVSSLKGSRYITFGGGNINGKLTEDVLESINNVISANAIKQGLLAAYQGIAYDVEMGDTGLEDAFAASFKLAKAHGFKVLVTVSHSAPYGIPDAPQLMSSFFESPYIDFLSPQLYTDGNETENDFSITDDVTWQQFAKATAHIVPSIVSTSLYPSAQTTFASYGVTTAGYIRWGSS